MPLEGSVLPLVSPICNDSSNVLLPHPRNTWIMLNKKHPDLSQKEIWPGAYLQNAPTLVTYNIKHSEDIERNLDTENISFYLLCSLLWGSFSLSIVVFSR